MYFSKCYKIFFFETLCSPGCQKIVFKKVSIQNYPKTYVF